MLWRPPLLSTKLLKDTKQKQMRKEEEEFRGNERTNERESSSVGSGSGTSSGDVFEEREREGGA